MGLGDILGSISPAFGLATGKGLLGKIEQPLAGAGMFGLTGLLTQLLGHHSAPQTPQTPQTPQIPQPQQAGASAYLTPYWGGTASPGGGVSGAPPSAGASPIQSVAGALQGGGDFHSGAGMSAAQGQPQQGGLASILAALGLSL